MTSAGETRDTPSKHQLGSRPNHATRFLVSAKMSEQTMNVSGPRMHSFDVSGASDGVYPQFRGNAMIAAEFRIYFRKCYPSCAIHKRIRYCSPTRTNTGVHRDR